MFGRKKQKIIDLTPKDCRAGSRSTSATKTAAAGLDVRDVVGGMTAWDAQGLPTKKGSA